MSRGVRTRVSVSYETGTPAAPPGPGPVIVPTGRNMYHLGKEGLSGTTRLIDLLYAGVVGRLVGLGEVELAAHLGDQVALFLENHPPFCCQTRRTGRWCDDVFLLFADIADVGGEEALVHGLVAEHLLHAIAGFLREFVLGRVDLLVDFRHARVKLRGCSGNWGCSSSVRPPFLFQVSREFIRNLIV